MAGIDATQRKLIFPPRFVPYLEKHRIFELFHELAELLVQERPKDHVTFLRDALECASKRRAAPRIVFIAPPSFDKESFAREIAKILGIECYTRDDIIMIERHKKMLQRSKSEEEFEEMVAEGEYICVCPEEVYAGEFPDHYSIPYAPQEMSEADIEPQYQSPIYDRSKKSWSSTEEMSEESFSHESIPTEPRAPEPTEPPKPEQRSRVASTAMERRGTVVESRRGTVIQMEKTETIVEEIQIEEKEGEGEKFKGKKVCPCKRQDEDLEDETGRTVNLRMGGDTSKSGLRKSESLIPEADQGKDRGRPKRRGRKREKGDGYDGDDMKEYEHRGESLELSCVCLDDESEIDFGVLGKCEYSGKGWILIDFPESAEEAEHLAAQGVLPTHAIRIVTGGEDENLRNYKYFAKEWVQVYKSLPVMEIHENGRNLPNFARDVCKVVKVMPHRHPPMLPRILLIGCRGSGATTQANFLAKKYKIVHVEFEIEMARAVLHNDKLSETYKRQALFRPDPELEAAVLEKILLSPRCRKQGWVLTGYPTNVDQMRMMDLMATPPNRIIFIEVPAKECFIRLFYRKTDWVDGKEYRIPAFESFGVEGMKTVGIPPEVKDRLLSHPRDDRRQIIHDIETYLVEKEDMMQYCGNTAAYVNGNKSVDAVFEQIDDIIIKPAPAEPPRNPLAVGHGIQEAYERWQSMRLSSGITLNNLLFNPPKPGF